MGLLHEELTYKLRACFYDVHNALGTGYNEESYHIALVRRLKGSKIPFQSKVVNYVEHRGKKVHKFVADLVVADKIILELKSIQSDFHPINYFQILSYLKCWKMELGLLVNFGLPKVNIKRIPFTEKEQIIEEHYDAINNLINTDNQIFLRNLREALLTVLELHGLGYGESVYQTLLLEEMTFRNIPFAPQTIIPLEYEGEIIHNFEMKYPVIANSVICCISALKEDISYDIEKVQTYLKDLGLEIGILAHFGKEKLELIGVHP